MDQIPNIFKAYDIRGLVDTEIDADFAFATGMAFARFLQIEREPGTVVIGEDMRPSSPELAEAFSAGVTSQSMDVIRIGLASTDMLYFASGKLIENFVREGSPIALRNVGVEKHRDMLSEYVDHLLSLVDVTKIRPLKIVVDAGNGMAGHTAPAIFARLNCEVIPMYFELDGSFPNHEANPLDESTLKDLKQAMIDHKADLGLAFDGDADRCFLVDEKGAAVNPSALTALIAQRELKKRPGSKIIYNLISSRAVAEVISENGGTGLRSRVGHSYIKKMMAESGAIFGGEHSGHFYFKEFWMADSGALAALHAIAALGESNATMSELLAPFNRYISSGEINSKVSSTQQATDLVRSTYQAQNVSLDELDGLTVNGDTWWFNLRPSNTEPLLRLNVEASSQAQMESVRDEVLALIRG